jgi:hypothetical protein
VASRKWIWSEICWLSALLIYGALAAFAVHRKLPAEVWSSGEYTLPALDFERTHHIASIFLPPGYPAWVGMNRILFHGDGGLFAANLVIQLLCVTAVWILLREWGANVKQAFVAGLVFASYPDTLLTINKAAHIALTTLMVLAIVCAAVWMVRRRKGYAPDIAIAVVTGLAVLSRPNLLLLLPLTWMLLWRYRLPHAGWRAMGQAVCAFAIYAAVTVGVHGSVFWPQMGPYNLFAGANEFTQADMQRSYDNAAEGSIIPALHARGIEAYHDWSKPDDLPGDNESRNLRFRTTYSHEALKFMRNHPGTMVKLSWMKAVDFFRPDLQVHRWRSPAGMLKILFAGAIWIWLGVWWWLRREVNSQAIFITAAVVLCFVLPHVVLVSAPHYRIPLDVLCFVSTVGMLCAHWNRARAVGRTI